MKTKILYFLLLCVLNTIASFANHFDYSTLAQQAYRKATALHLKEARSIVEQLKQKEPRNLIVHHLDNYIDCLSILTTEDKTAFENLKARKKDRLAKVENGDDKSPYYLFVQADIRLQWALIRLKFGEHFGAFMDVSKAFKLLKKNEKLFPEFMPNKKDLALMRTLAGTIPDSYKWGVKLISGIEGDIVQGIEETEEVLKYAEKHEFLFEEETLLMYGLLLFHYAEQPQKAWQLLKGRLKPSSNLLHCFILSHISMRIGENDFAIRLLENRPKGRHIHPFPFLEHMLGGAKLRKLDSNARQHFVNFLLEYKGRNLIKDTYRKLAWHALIFEDEKKYRFYMQACLHKGTADVGDDRSALNEAKQGTLPNKVLLESRLLFDGGYHQKALYKIKQLPITKISDIPIRLEYFYRLGRIQQGLKNYDQAFFNYNLTIQKGKNAPYFYACNAALQSAKIYEQLKAYDKAKERYELCLSISPQEYRVSLHTQAKAGLQRVKRK